MRVDATSWSGPAPHGAQSMASSSRCTKDCALYQSCIRPKMRLQATDYGSNLLNVKSHFMSERPGWM